MPYLHLKGSPSSLCWVIIDKPYPSDIAKGYVFSGGMGYVFEKMMQSAGISDYYVAARRPNTDHTDSYAILENDLNHYRPPIIITLEEAGKFLISELAPKYSKVKSEAAEEEESEIQKYAGSLLQSPLLKYPHYIIPTFGPDTIIKQWQERDIVVNLDLGKAKSELDYFKAHGTLEPLPLRTLKYEMDFEETLFEVSKCRNSNLVSVDIETVYTNTKSRYYPHPGYPVTVGLATSRLYGISFNLFWPKLHQTMELWRTLATVLAEVPNLGQNYFNFDAPRFEVLGFEIDYEKIQDTLLRHHILWPELPHKLQFQTRQYTREPYYKDEGKQWNLKDMKQLRRYNCLDVVVTYEVYLEQEKEFDDRPHLR